MTTSNPVRLSKLFKLAILSGQQDLVSFHLKNGCHLNATDEKGKSPLQLAAESGHIGICELLIKSGAQVSSEISAANPILDQVLKSKVEQSKTEQLHLNLYDTRIQEPSSVLEIQSINFADWEEDITIVPQSNPNIEKQSRLQEAKRSAHKVEDKSESWADVEIDLPDRNSKLDDADAVRLQALLRHGLIEGRIPRILLEIGKSQFDPDLQKCIDLAIEIGGIEVDDAPWDWLLTISGIDEILPLNPKSEWIESQIDGYLDVINYLYSESTHGHFRYFKELSTIHRRQIEDTSETIRQFSKLIKAEYKDHGHSNDIPDDIRMELETDSIISSQRNPSLYSDTMIRQREAIIISNLKFVVSIAKKYTNPVVELADLIQEGNSGLITAIDKFDFGRGVKIGTYAVWWIRQSILKYMSDTKRTIRFPNNVQADLSKLETAMRKLNISEPSNFSALELSRETSLGIDVIENLFRLPIQSIEIDHFESDDEDGSSEAPRLYSSADPESEFIDKSDLERIRKLVETLPEVHARVIKLRYGIDGGGAYTLEEVAESIGVTRERVRQIANKSLERLKKAISKQP